MTVEGCSRVMKYILVGFNAIILIGGAVAIGLGAWAYASEYGAEKLKAITGSNLYEGACIVIIVGGCIIVTLSFLGCCGAFMENRVLLGLYFVIMLLLLILFVVVAVLGFVFRDDVRDELEKEMRNTLINEYGVSNAQTTVWDEFQIKLRCCGVSGGLTSDDSWFLWQSSKWFKNRNQTAMNKMYVPPSCCNKNFAQSDCTGLKVSNIRMPVQLSTATISEDNPALYEKGCIDALEDEIKDHIVAVAIIAVIVLIVMVLCITFAVCVCMEVGKPSMVV